MNAREEILSSIRARTSTAAARPPPYAPPVQSGDAVERFAARATAAAAQVITLASADEIPAAIAGVLRARNLAARLHVPPDQQVAAHVSSDIVEVRGEPPGPDDVALAYAAHAIAETGTLVYPSARERPASWHFRAGIEIAILSRGDICATLEEVLARIEQTGGLPSTLNLVTGPSRTGDIEQTLELGAHGPKELVIFVVP